MRRIDLLVVVLMVAFVVISAIAVSNLVTNL